MKMYEEEADKKLGFKGSKVVRFEKLDKTARDYNKRMRKQLDDFEKEAKKGKTICISDLMGNAGL